MEVCHDAVPPPLSDEEQAERNSAQSSIRRRDLRMGCWVNERWGDFKVSSAAASANGARLHPRRYSGSAVCFFLA
jgi:hypothetical protein